MTMYKSCGFDCFDVAYEVGIVRTHAYTLTLSVVVVFLAVSMRAYSQERQANAVEEVVVTATKREQRLQDVPMSISALTADTIDKRGFVSAEDYLRSIPGVSQIGQDGEQKIVIRGIESGSGNNLFTGPTTAVYFGETPVSESAGLGAQSANDLKLVDIARVEVLRGPQGTAFGNSSLGGAIRVIPTEPNITKAEGKISGDYSSTSKLGGDNYSAHGILNVPIVREVIAARAVAYRTQDSGYYRNVSASDAAYRAAVITPNGAEPYAVDLGRAGDREIWGGRITLLTLPVDELRLSVSYINQRTEQDGRPMTNNGSMYEQVDVVFPSKDGQHRRKNFSHWDTRTEIVNGVADYDMGWSNIVATYSHVKGSSTQASGFYFLPSPWWGESSQTSDIGEVRLATKLDGHINAIAGVYYENAESQNLGRFYWAGDISRSPFRPLLDPSAFLLGRREDGRNLEQQAAFGEITWEVIQHVFVTGGARIYSYQRKYREFTRGAFYGNGTDIYLEQDVSDESVKANVSYRPDETINLYAGWAQGFRLGRPNPTLPPTCDVNPADGLLDGTIIPVLGSATLRSDTVDSYEVGGKFGFLGRRLQVDASAFRVDWTDIPIFVPVGSCSLGTFLNVGQAKSEGIEAQLSFQMTEALRVELGGSYTNARILQDVTLANILKGDRLPQSPQYNANLGLEQAFDVLGRDAFIRADASYVGEFYAGAAETEVTKAGNYTLVDIAAGISFDRIMLSVFGKNLANNDAFTFRNGTGYAAPSQRLRPRTVGVRVEYTF